MFSVIAMGLIGVGVSLGVLALLHLMLTLVRVWGEITWSQNAMERRWR